jgi:hypothetical protein
MTHEDIIPNLGFRLKWRTSGSDHFTLKKEILVPVWIGRNLGGPEGLSRCGTGNLARRHFAVIHIKQFKVKINLQKISHLTTGEERP